MSRLDWMVDWIEMAQAAGYHAERLAPMCCVSPAQLRRYFLVRCSRPPQEWLDELRLWHAVRMLFTGESVKGVAAALHFSDSAHLCHAFKEYFGDSPQRTIWKMQMELRAKGHLALGWEESGGMEPWKAAEHRLLRPLLRRKPPAPKQMNRRK
jgi:transcriptional regulator GlxA family with amidase domain